MLKTRDLHVFHVQRHFNSLFFFNDTAATEIYTLSLHDALPISLALLTMYSSEHNRESMSFQGTTSTRRSEEHTSELQSQSNLVCRLLLEKKKLHQHRDQIFPHSSNAKQTAVPHVVV